MPALTDLPYIPNARDVRFGVITRLGHTWCLTCAESHADGDGHDRPDYTPGDRCYVYGDHDGGIDYGDDALCRLCGRNLAADARAQQSDHDEQQRGWSRMSREVTHEHVNGGTFGFAGGGIRCY